MSKTLADLLGSSSEDDRALKRSNSGSRRVVRRRPSSRGSVDSTRSVDGGRGAGAAPAASSSAAASAATASSAAAAAAAAALRKSAESPTPSAAQLARQQRLRDAEERRRKQDELRDRMRAALGDEKVEAVAQQAAKQQQPQLGAAMNESVSSSQGSFRQAATAQAAGASPAGIRRPPTAPTPTDSLKKLDINAIRQGEAFGLTPKKPLGAADFDDAPSATAPPYGIYVTDRGTQTACTVECQTDPDPRDLRCNGCYADYYGHAAPGVDLIGGFEPGGLVQSVLMGQVRHGAGVLAGRGYSAAPGAFQHNHPTSSAATEQAGGVATGVAYHNHVAARFPAAEALAQSKTLQALKAQLAMIETTVDSFVHKYNLPATPVAL